ncbi:MAG: methionine--tRNA ligase [Rickettsiales bacterium]|jgi:methionyl-tRNA synthetase|nr:methionine--tRNA ligase [Rickettsiales bacterium]
MQKTAFITSPIYYVSAEPHVGSAYSTLCCDFLARFYKLDDYDVKFLTGTDEHGQKIEQSSRAESKSPKEFVDELSIRFREILKTLDIHPSYFDSIKDSFIRTTMKEHIEGIQEVWKVLVKNGWIYRGKYEGWYCISDEAYYDASELDKNENGEFIAKLSGKKVEWRVEETYFFKLGEFQELLLRLYKEFPDFVKPNTKKTEVVSFVSGISIKDYEDGKPIIIGHLKDLSVSRNNFDWGIRIPIDDNGKDLLDENGNWKEGLNASEKQVIYVWLDALFNYITALGSKTKYADYQKYWLNGSKKIHIVGKDILRFHAVYWPAFLLAYNYTREEISKISDLNEFKDCLFSNVFAHGWILNNSQKISKSLGNGIYPYMEIEWLQTSNIDANTARDYLRYYILTCIQSGYDGSYSRTDVIETINSKLANKIGNLFKRVLELIYNNFDGKIPDSDAVANATDIDRFREYINNVNIVEYVDGVLQIASDTNKYMEDNRPWILVKTNKEEAREILYKAAHNLYKIAVLLQPITPYLSNELLKSLGYDKPINFSKINEKLNSNTIEKTKIIMPRLTITE